MTRQVRRQLERQKNKTITLTYAQLEDRLVKERRATSEATVNLIAGAFLLKLMDKFGFGEKRLLRILGHTRETIDAINGGYITSEDILGELKKKGIDLYT